MNRRVEILSALLVFIAIALRAEAQDPERVRPSTGDRWGAAQSNGRRGRYAR
jgi:hypothetical protein